MGDAYPKDVKENYPKALAIKKYIYIYIDNYSHYCLSYHQPGGK